MIHISSSLSVRLGLGFIVWAAWATTNLQGLLHPSWGRMLVLFAALVVVPITIDLVLKDSRLPPFIFMKKGSNWLLPSAIALVFAYSIEQGNLAGSLTLPWLLVTFLTAFEGLRFLLTLHSHFSISTLTIGTGMAYLSVGGIWALTDRMGWRPMGYDPEIVFLTVAHFHYAGFVLPIVAGFVFGKMKDRLAKAMVIGILTGVLLVAAGIVQTQLGGGPSLEGMAAWWLAISAMVLAFLQTKLALRRGIPPMAAVCWTLAAVALMGGMVLAGLYGIRHLFPVAGLDIPLMRFLHGTANAVGFGFFSVVGWWVYNGRK